MGLVGHSSLKGEEAGKIGGGGESRIEKRLTSSNEVSPALTIIQGAPAI